MAYWLCVLFLKSHERTQNSHYGLRLLPFTDKNSSGSPFRHLVEENHCEQNLGILVSPAYIICGYCHFHAAHRIAVVINFGIIQTILKVYPVALQPLLDKAASLCSIVQHLDQSLENKVLNFGTDL